MASTTGMLLLLALATCADLCRGAAPTPAPEANCSSVIELARGNANLSTLYALVEEAGLEGALEDKAFAGTVFAPTNAAFEELLGRLGIDAAALTSNKDLLKSLLSYHVAPTKIVMADVAAGKDVQVPTLLAGEQLKVEKYAGGKLEVIPSGSEPLAPESGVTKSDIQACNANVQLVEKVLVPKSLSDQLTAAASGGSAPAPSGSDSAPAPSTSGAPSSGTWAAAAALGAAALALV